MKIYNLRQWSNLIAKYPILVNDDILLDSSILDNEEDLEESIISWVYCDYREYGQINNIKINRITVKELTNICNDNNGYVYEYFINNDRYLYLLNNSLDDNNIIIIIIER